MWEESDRAIKEVLDLNQQTLQAHIRACHDPGAAQRHDPLAYHHMHMQNVERQRHVEALKRSAAELRWKASAVSQKAFGLLDERMDTFLHDQGWMLVTDFALRWALRRLALGKSLHSRLTHESVVVKSWFPVNCLLDVAEYLQQIEAVQRRDPERGAFVHWNDRALAELAAARTASSELITAAEGDEDRDAHTLTVYVGSLQPYTVYQFRARYFFQPSVEQAMTSQVLSPVAEVLCREHISPAQAEKSMETWDPAQSAEWVVSVLGEMVDADQVREDFREEEIRGAVLKDRLQGTASRMQRLLRGSVTNPAEAVSLLVESAVELERRLSQAQAEKSMETWDPAQSAEWVVSVLGEMVDADQVREDFREEEIRGAVLKDRLQGTASRMQRLLRGSVTNPAEAVSLLVESAVELERRLSQAPVAEGIPPRSNNWFVPAHWDRMEADQKLARVPVAPEVDPALWKELDARVSASLPEFNLVSIERVQNKALWRRYVTFRQQIAEEHGQDAVNERDLFHFAGKAALEAVVSSDSVGFDPRLGGSSEYGAGTYFAEHAIYPVAYGMGWLAGSCRAERLADAEVTLVLAKVVLGFCKDFGPRCRSDRGDAAADAMGLPRGLLGQDDWSARIAGRNPSNIFARPPQRPEAGPNELYHSVCGTEGDLAWTENSRLRACGAKYGKQFVTFETAQAYPELILKLQRKPSHDLAMMEQERGESDKAMTLGTHVFINEVGRGTISGFTRNIVGANSHHVTLHETGELYILRVREVLWWVEQPAQLLDAADAAALERDLDELSGAIAEAQSEVLPQARVAVVGGTSYKS